MGGARNTRRRLGRAAALGSLVGGLAVAMAACSTSPPEVFNGLELIVATDGLNAPADFDDIRLEIREQADGGWSTLWNRDYVVPSTEAMLPAAFTLLAGPTPREVLISVTAFKGQASPLPVVQRVVQVQVPTDRLADMWLVLSRECVGQVVIAGAEGEPTPTCTPGQSCQPLGPTRGRCGSNEVDVTTLPTYVPGQDFDAAGAPMVGGDAATESMAGDDGGDSTLGPGVEEDAAGASTDATLADGDATDAWADSMVAQIVPDSAPDGPTCTAACTVGLTQCSGTDVQTCQAPPGGCARWVTTATCGVNQTCQIGDAAPSCTCKANSCTEVGTVCEDGQTLATCAQDNSGCFYTASASACPANQSCSGMAPTAACSSTCTNSCVQSQTVCGSGGLKTCTLGTNGCLSYGAAMPCGMHQSCTGSTGSAACTCNTDPICRGASAACANPTTLATCANDAQNCPYEVSSAQCANGACSAGACCTNACTQGQAKCINGNLATCTQGTNGCWSYGPPASCSVNFACTGPDGSAACTSTVTVANIFGMPNMFNEQVSDSLILLPCYNTAAQDCIVIASGTACPNQNNMALPYEDRGAQFNESFPLGGTVGQMYMASFHVDGITEAKYYENGTCQGSDTPATCAAGRAAGLGDPPAATTNTFVSCTAPNPSQCNDTWYTGGDPIDYEFYKVYKLTVYAPSPDGGVGAEVQHYYLNSFPKTATTYETHSTYFVSYSHTIPVPGGGTIELKAGDTSCHAIDNCGPGTFIQTCLPNVGRQLPGLAIPSMHMGLSTSTLNFRTGAAQPWHSQIFHVTVTAVTGM